jgi:CubicO group peptidase (beta-lactamase class C family)
MLRTVLLTLVLALCASKLVQAQTATAPHPTAPNALAASAPAFITDSLDQYIRRGMEDWQIPGLAIVVLKDGKPVLMKGYGTREVGKDAPVDENTLFFIASNTKLFTGTAISQLDENKQLSLTDRVTKFFPDFRLYDSNATRMLDVRDLLSHHLGTKTFQGDFSFWDSNLGRDAIMAKMRLLQPAGQFRQDFGYCNSCFLAAGQLIPKVTGQSWDDYIRQHFLLPLGMTNTYTVTAGAAFRKNIARPYTSLYGDLVALPYDQVDNLGPAASLVSCVKDLSHWLQMQLDSGRFGGKTLFPWSVIQRTRIAGTIISSTQNKAIPMHYEDYGLGIFNGDYNGHQVYWHTGGAMGFVTNTCFVPDAHLAISILTNNDDQEFFEALRFQILDAYLGIPYVNRSRQFLAGFLREKAKTLDNVKEWTDKAKKAGLPTLPLAAFTGTYVNPVYGKINIIQDHNKLRILFEHHPNLDASLAYMGNDTFLMTFSNLSFGIFPAPFMISKGKVRNVSIKVADGLEYDPYIFVKS